MKCLTKNKGKQKVIIYELEPILLESNINKWNSIVISLLGNIYRNQLSSDSGKILKIVI